MPWMQEKEKLVAGGQVAERPVSPPDIIQSFKGLLVMDEKGRVGS